MNLPMRHARAIALTLLCLTACAGTARHPSLLPSNIATAANPSIHDDHLLKIDGERVRLTRDYLQIHHPAFAARLPDENTPEAIALEPRVVVIHYTVLPTLEQVIDYFQSPHIEGSREIIRANGLLNVGVQFVVDRDGAIYRFYPENVIARHTIGLNHLAIGVENVGDGDLDDPSASFPLTRAQLEANVALVRYLAARYDSLDLVIGHHEYRDLEDSNHPGHALFHEEIPSYRTEKSDPGPRFMKALRERIAQP